MNKQEQELLDWIHTYYELLECGTDDRIKQLIHSVKQSGMREAAEVAIDSTMPGKAFPGAVAKSDHNVACHFIRKAILTEAEKP